MGKLLYLKDYRSPPEIKLVERVPMPEPRSVVHSPLFLAPDTLFLIRKYLGQNIERFAPDHVVMPITKDLDPFWALDIRSGWFNSLFAPCSAFFAAIRDFPKEVVQFVDGTIVAQQADYDRLRHDFNEQYVKARDHQGSGKPKGTLSRDEFIRLTSLFYLWSKTTDTAHGIQFDMMGDLATRWCGESRVVHLNFRMAQMYAERLQDCYFVAVPWKQFFFRAQNELKHDRTSWIYNLSDVDVFANDNPWDITFQEFVEMLDLVATGDASRHQVTIVLPNMPELEQWVQQVYPATRLCVDSKGLGKNYMVVSNYRFQ